MVSDPIYCNPIYCKPLGQSAKMIGKMRDERDRRVSEIAHLLGREATAEVLDEELRIACFDDNARNAREISLVCFAECGVAEARGRQLQRRVRANHCTFHHHLDR